MSRPVFRGLIRWRPMPKSLPSKGWWDENAGPASNLSAECIPVWGESMVHYDLHCGGVWRLNDPWVLCDRCGAHAPATLANIDKMWADNAGQTNMLDGAG